MDRWNGKVAVVTGASSGIGLATAKALVQHGMTVVGLARRKAQMETNMKDVKGADKFYARECDITKEESVIESLNWTKNTFGSLNVLINNSGRSILNKIEDLPTADLEQTIQVNIMGVLYCSKQAIKLMKENKNEAHIVNVNSLLGHMILPAQFGFYNVYPATKFAVRALSETLKQELLDSKIRVTNISPGAVKTEMFAKSLEKNPNLLHMPALDAEDLANSIIFALGVPPHVEINEIILQAKQM